MAGYNGNGGAIHSDNSIMNIVNCVFTENTASWSGGVFYIENNSDIYIDTCTFSDNKTYDAGGVFYVDSSSVTILNSIFERNNSYSGHSFINSGGVLYSVNNSDCSISSSNFIGNFVVKDDFGVINYGGVFGGLDSLSTISNSIFAYNKGGGTIEIIDSLNVPKVYCSNFYSNANEDWSTDFTWLSVSNNNFSLDPLFCDTANSNYQIYDNSPCAPGNNACSTLIGAFGVGCVFPFIDNVLLSNEESDNVINHSPELSWNESSLQTEIEIAIGTDNDWVVAEMWNPAPLTSADTFVTYNGSTLIDGETYYGRLKVSNGTAWSDWFEFSFRMNSKPTTPVALSPIDNTITNSTPTLWIDNSFDVEGDSLFYDFSGNKFTGTGMVYEPLLVGNKIVEQTDSTSLDVPSPLEENALFFWEVRAYDGYEYSGWTTLLSSAFWVNDVNEPPTAPVALNPDETTSPLYNMQPTFSWIESDDPDPFFDIYYKLHLAIDSNFIFETVIDSIYSTDSIAVNTYTLTFPLEYSKQYWWKVEATDSLGVSSMSNRQHFWTSCCVGIRGNVDSDLLDQIDIADLVYLVAYMFQGGFPYSCEDEADIDGSGGETPIDISDLVILVAYMFQGGDAPADCP